MKKVLTFVFALSIVFYLSNLSTFAQGRGTGQGPAVSSAHIPDTSSSDHGKSADHANTTHSQSHSGSQANFMDRIIRNQGLIDWLIKLLLSEWTSTNPPGTLAGAADGFKNEGAFISFLHVSKNLGLKYDQWVDMRTKLTTGGESLGKCIHDVKPELSQTQINVQVQTAQQEAKDDQKTKS